MKRTSAILLTGAALVCGGAQGALRDVESRVDSLMSLMTLDEKIGQLNQLSGYGYHPDMVGQIRIGSVGSLLNEVDPVVVNKLQKEAVENTRLHIPLVFARDVIHGFKTMFPIPVGQAATWNPEIVEQGSRVSAREASSAGVRWTFSPMVDIARDARWGRLAEGYGEDPYLTAVMGVAAVKGYQGDDLTRPDAIAACTKHFAGYGMSESGRDYNTANVTGTVLHDVILSPFKACADAGSATFMCSFNDIDGIPSSANRKLLRGILRDRWGWDGLLVSDWNSIGDMLKHGTAADLKEASLQALHAGVDMDMEAHGYTQYIKELIEAGRISEMEIDALVRNVLRLKFRLGLFENPYVDEKNMNRFFEKESLAAAQRAAEESAILLTNNGILPMKGSERILVVGPMADAKHDQNGTWCFDLDKDRTVTVLEGLRKAYGAKNVTYVPGLQFSRDRSDAEFAKAVAAAGKCDVIVFVGGEEAVLSGEAHCRADISLPGAQTELIRELKKTGKPLVAVLLSGRPLTLPEESELCDAILFCFHNGTMGGPAVANLLTGKVNPSGKLPVTMPRMVGQVPIYYAHKNTGRPTEGEIMLMDQIPLEAGQTSTGCTSFWLDAGLAPLYPFGYGLSYTTFEYGKPELSATSMDGNGEITVKCRVTNTGKTRGADVAQLYVRDMVASLAQPVKQLKGFEKVWLNPGESKTVTFTLPASRLAFHDTEGNEITEPGEFTLWVDNSSDCKTAPVKFSITENNSAYEK